MSNNVKLLTTNNYDENLYEAVGSERGIIVHAVSFIRGFAGNLMGVFGGKNDLIAKKVEDVYKEAMDELVKNAKSTYGNDIDQIIALDIELSEMTEFIICVAAGTVLKRKTSSQPIATGGKNNKSRKHKK